MPTVRVSLPAVITSPEPAVDIECEAVTVAAALRAAVAQAPRFAPRVFFADRLLVSVIVNGRTLPPAVAASTPLAAGDHVAVIPPVAGG